MGFSQYGLRKNAEAYRTLSELAKRSPEREKIARFAEVLARTLQESRRSGAEIPDLFNRAIELYKADKNTQKQIDLLFDLAKIYEQRSYFSNGEGVSWQTREIDAVIRTLETYDRILVMETSAEEQIRACHAKVDALVNSAGLLQDWPLDQWPVGLKSKYDLSKPIPLAIEFEREIIRRFPDRPEAAEALLQIAQLQANQLQDFVQAVKTYEEVIERFARLADVAKRARQAIGSIKAPVLMLSVDDIALPGTNVKYHWSATTSRPSMWQPTRLI